jgi:lipase ATG15
MLSHPWTSFLVALFTSLICYAAHQSPFTLSSRQPLWLKLRHLHAVTNSTKVIFANPSPIDPMDTSYNPLESYSLLARPVTTYRPSFSGLERLHHHDWEEDIILGPDVESREVLLELAKMMNNAYLRPDEDGWYDLGDKWSPVCSAAKMIFEK